MSDVLQLVGVVVVPRLLLGPFVVRENEVLFVVVWCGVLHGPEVPYVRVRVLVDPQPFALQLFGVVVVRVRVLVDPQPFVLQLFGVVVVSRLLLGAGVERDSEVLFGVVWRVLLHGSEVPSARFG